MKNLLNHSKSSLLDLISLYYLSVIPEYTIFPCVEKFSKCKLLIFPKCYNISATHLWIIFSISLNTSVPYFSSPNTFLSELSTPFLHSLSSYLGILINWHSGSFPLQFSCVGVLDTVFALVVYPSVDKSTPSRIFLEEATLEVNILSPCKCDNVICLFLFERLSRILAWELFSLVISLVHCVEFPVLLMMRNLMSSWLLILYMTYFFAFWSF